MIEKIRKLNLAGLSYDRDGILNVLGDTAAVEIKTHAQTEGTEPLKAQDGELSDRLAAIENALDVLVACAESRAERDKRKNDLKDGFSVGIDEFSKIGEKRAEIEGAVKIAEEIVKKKAALAAEQTRLTRAVAAAIPYEGVKRPFSEYADTAHAVIKLGIMPLSAWETARKLLGEECAYEAVKVGDDALLTVACHRSDEETFKLLSGAGFSPCPFTENVTGAEKLARLRGELAEVEKELIKADDELYGQTFEIRNIKIYCDFLGFELEKLRADDKMRGTERTFFLEAFVPADDEERVKAALDGSGFAMWYSFSEPAADEATPTLLKNNPVVKNFESITNMYTPPNARELDPNTVMSFFYSLFLGFIMADIGYGLIMAAVGGFLYFKSRAKSGLKSLAGVFATGGIFAVVWGFLFNSLLGIAVLPFTVMPDAQHDMYSFLGIKIPSVLIIAMLIGIVQLFTGYIMKAVQEWRRGNVFDGICDGVTWAVFSLGVGLAIVGLVEDFALPSVLVWTGGIAAGVSLVAAAVTAGRKEKIVGKLTKGFGAFYGVINYVSDVLSYARLYGLMLSGAVIAQIVSQYALNFMQSGFALAIVGVILMAAGHLFNLAMGLLGAYIHDARLQYVEFYGRFFEGEGELFTPFGSSAKHIYLERKP